MAINYAPDLASLSGLTVNGTPITQAQYDAISRAYFQQYPNGMPFQTPGAAPYAGQAVATAQGSPMAGFYDLTGNVVPQYATQGVVNPFASPVQSGGGSAYAAPSIGQSSSGTVTGMGPAVPGMGPVFDPSTYVNNAANAASNQAGSTGAPGSVTATPTTGTAGTGLTGRVTPGTTTTTGVTPTQTAPAAANINPATGKQWTTNELMAKYYATFGKYPEPADGKDAGQVFNDWAGQQTGGLGWDSSGAASNPLPGAAAYTDKDGRNLLNEATANLQAQLAIAPYAFAAYQQYAPQMAQADLTTLGNTMFGQGNWGTTGQDLNRNLTIQAAQQTNLGNQLAREAAVGDIGQYGTQLAQLQKAQNPELWAAMANLQGQAGNVPTNQFQNQLGTMFSQGPQFSPITSQTVTGTQVGATPTVSAQANDLGLQTASGMLTSGGPSSLQRSLEQQAASDLALGKSLSAEDVRNAQQAAREGWAARGLVNSTGAVAEEVLNRDAVARQRENERRAFAQQVDTTGFGQRQQGFANALGLSGAAQGYAGLGLEAQRANQAAALQSALANQSASLTAQQSNQQSDLAAQQAQAGLGMQAWSQQAGLGQYLAGLQSTADQQKFNNLASVAQMYSANQVDPTRILGVGTANQGTNTGLFGTASGVTSGQTGSGQALSQFNPFSAYGADLANTNFNAQWTAQQNAANNAANLAAAKVAAGAGKTSGIAQGLGSLFGGALAGGLFGCWVARSVYGEDNPKWLLFRHWLTTQAPKWFRDLYCKYGPSFSKWLDKNPWAKPPIRLWMDSRIRSLARKQNITILTQQEAS